MPTGTASGDRVYVFQVTDDKVPGATPTSWTLLYDTYNVGTGTLGSGTGGRAGQVYYRDYDGTWAMPVFDMGNYPNTSHSLTAMTLRKGTTDTWQTPEAFLNSNNPNDASFGTPTTAYSYTENSANPPNNTTQVGALFMAFTITNDNVTSVSPVISATGQTFTNVTERADGGTSSAFQTSLKLHTANLSVGGTNPRKITQTMSAATEGFTLFLQQTVIGATINIAAPNMVATAAWKLPTIGAGKTVAAPKITATAAQPVPTIRADRHPRKMPTVISQAVSRSSLN